MQSFGFFEPKYDLEDSAAYKIRLSEIRNKQKEMVIKKDAASYNSNWTVNGSKAEGRKMNNNLLKLAIRSFNNECDVAISKVKVSNIKSMEDRINRTFETINKLNASNQIQLKVNYLNLKHEELYLALEYNQKLEKEKEEQREIREQIREEEKARREIAKLKEAIEKEEKHFIQALQKLEKQKEDATQEQLSELELKIAELNQKLEEINEQKEDVLNRERNTRAGYVYVISNIGSFGEDVYKIGMTRRLEPLDRVKELGSASVPFLFDVHAMIFSEDAPTLENTLHRTFNDKRLNLINERKEFFKVSLEEIQDVVERNHDKTIEFKTTALAEDYRQTLAHRKQLEETKKELVIT
ncbi:ATPase [Sporosarcina sp. P3]|nr:ATPase [Sporosarcina sp. P3]